jgi:16S rRNA (cytidine1402-2'-O)-methyltransferase
MPLLLVGTPIGNLDDLSPRAVASLRSASAIYCEDTRVAARLAARFALRAPRFSCHEHNEIRRVPEVLRRLAAGETVALTSDAGMPGLSDPGAAVVRAAADAGFRVSVVPGPSAPAAALAVSGFPGSPHLFLGFPPSRSGERRRFFAAVAGRSETLVWFEAPHRIARSLADAAGLLGNRRACLCRELTKIHEEIVHATLPALAEAAARRQKILGEITLVAEGRIEEEEPSITPDRGEQIRETIANLERQGFSKKQIARRLARETGRPSREIYAMLLPKS